MAAMAALGRTAVRSHRGRETMKIEDLLLLMNHFGSSREIIQDVWDNMDNQEKVDQVHGMANKEVEVPIMELGPRAVALMTPEHLVRFMAGDGIDQLRVVMELGYYDVSQKRAAKNIKQRFELRIYQPGNRWWDHTFTVFGDADEFRNLIKPMKIAEGRKRIQQYALSDAFNGYLVYYHTGAIGPIVQSWSVWVAGIIMATGLTHQALTMIAQRKKWDMILRALQEGYLT
jgi:hypothetical protein